MISVVHVYLINDVLNVMNHVELRHCKPQGCILGLVCQNFRTISATKVDRTETLVDVARTMSTVGMNLADL